QADRLRAAQLLARRSRAVVILKGAHSLVAEPSGGIAVNPTGSPLLAAAGSGDVLSGIVGALWAGGLGAREAAVAGAWLHGAAADSRAPLFGDAGLPSRARACRPFCAAGPWGPRGGRRRSRCWGRRCADDAPPKASSRARHGPGR